ncbi:DUF6880 family protein [Rhizobium oryziradicis]|uniref:Uncharacterized protein n=1 Tax=Rhizobium oryziradicis TaxID=1867956 RepID=A0A1Q8ZVZ7_9HYPH|nr:DUF6880 family protein [Rhizobium oryziradicis]OLP46109.1 hypothetical protein BJF95_02840 [Rhizobium oryziradicis]
MAKKAVVKFDKKGLSSLGAEKLAEILLEEAAANKPLKIRLQAAIAGEGGSAKICAMLDKRLDQIEKSTSRITAAKSRDMAVELSGMVRTIHAELGSVDRLAASERMLRLVAMQLLLLHRLYDRSVKLEKFFDQANEAAVSLVSDLDPAQQIALVPTIEKMRSADLSSEQDDFFTRLMTGLSVEAAEDWKAFLQKVPAKNRTYPSALGLLQLLAQKQGDFKRMSALEDLKPEMFQNSLQMAQLLFDAGQFEDALIWARRKPKGMHMVYVGGIRAAAGPEYGARERKLLETEILDRLKRRDEAQKLRWDIFCESFDVDMLRQYLSKLDDFAEFDEMDKAIALVLADKNINKALLFLVQWPKLDLAAQYIIDHAKEWDGRYYEMLSDVSLALRDDYPIAATVLDRALLNDILNRNLSPAYEFAARCLAGLEEMSSRISAETSLPSHVQFMQGLRSKHARKYSFWMLVPHELR